MKQVACGGGDSCSSYRVHHEEPYTPRGVQYVKVEDDYPDDKKAYCSITCAVYDGAFSIRKKTE